MIQADSYPWSDVLDENAEPRSAGTARPKELLDAKQYDDRQ